MTPQGWVAIIVAVIALLSALGSAYLATELNARSARKAEQSAQKVAAQKVDAEAYARAQTTYQAALDEQQHRVERMQAELDSRESAYTVEVAEVQARLAHLEDDRTADRRRMQQLAHDLAQMKEWARDLLRTLRRRGVQFPPPPVDLGDTDPNVDGGGTA